MITFIFLGIEITSVLNIQKNSFIEIMTQYKFIYNMTDIFVYLTVFVCIIRGLAVLWNGKKILIKKNNFI